MSDSLRDQLLKAGFKPEKTTAKPKQTKKRKSPMGNSPTSNTATGNSSGKKSNVSNQHRKQADRHGKSGVAAKQAAVDNNAAMEASAKKALKEKIKVLIETHKVKEHAGPVAFSYQVGTRLKQIFVTEDCQQKLATEELVITRLNGSTLLVPTDIGQEILALNPEWAVHVPGNVSENASDVTDEYADHKIPDDLIW